MTSIAPQVVLGLFTAGGVTVTLAGTSLQRHLDRKREDARRFEVQRFVAMTELLTAATRYRHAILASYALGSFDQRAESAPAARARWSEELQTSFELYHYAAVGFDLMIPDDARRQLRDISAALDQLRSIRPPTSVDGADKFARTTISRLADTCREILGTGSGRPTVT